MNLGKSSVLVKSYLRGFQGCNPASHSPSGLCIAGGVLIMLPLTMKLLCFQAKRFWWKTYSKSLPDVGSQEAEEVVRETLVVFVHAEAPDEGSERRDSVRRQTPNARLARPPPLVPSPGRVLPEARAKWIVPT